MSAAAPVSAGVGGGGKRLLAAAVAMSQPALVTIAQRLAQRLAPAASSTAGPLTVAPSAAGPVAGNGGSSSTTSGGSGSGGRGKGSDASSVPFTRPAAISLADRLRCFSSSSSSLAASAAAAPAAVAEEGGGAAAATAAVEGSREEPGREEGGRQSGGNPWRHAQRGRAPAAAAGVGAGLMADLTNCPRYMLKGELLALLRAAGCSAEGTRAYIVLDEKVRAKTWRVQFASMEDYERAMAALAARRQWIGTRLVRLRQLTASETAAEADGQGQLAWTNAVATPFRDRSLLMMNVPNEVRQDAIERFFHGYSLDPRASFSFRSKRVSFQTPGGSQPLSPAQQQQADGGVDRRVIVKFSSQAEALRALRERQQAFLMDRQIDLRLLQ